MSYDIYLHDPEDGQPCFVDRHTEGGTYDMHGSHEAHLNTTYNYAPYYHAHLGDGGIRSIYGQTGEIAAPRLRAAIAAIEADEALETRLLTTGAARRADYLAEPPPADDDTGPLAELARSQRRTAANWEPGNYWDPTRANAARALTILLAWAEQHPEGVFDGD